VTFTNKAAREMLGRVNELVPKARSADGERPKRPTICTFHSLCVRILRRHIGKLGYKPSFTIYDDTEQLGVMKRVLANLSAGGAPSSPSSAASGTRPAAGCPAPTRPCWRWRSISAAVTSPPSARPTRWTSTT
ncbi:MAG TPA: UvrD-helicase domain-containing protein, partial [Verrucomicrobiota bacterium]|nr:UvrD-helicase domain-containing protein [Verrucomicrobiota bacterium]